MICRNCGKEIHEGDLFCSYCGISAADAAEKDAGECRVCGRHLHADDAFCPYCGTSVHAEPQPAQKNENVCAKCGKEIHEGDLFCPYCGERCAPAAQQMSAALPPPPAYYPPAAQGQPAAVQADAPSGGFFALGFFFPVVGLILFLVWKGQFPLRAKSCGKGALVGFIVQFVLGFIAGFLIGYFGMADVVYAATAAPVPF